MRRRCVESDRGFEGDVFGKIAPFIGSKELIELWGQGVSFFEGRRFEMMMAEAMRLGWVGTGEGEVYEELSRRIVDRGPLLSYEEYMLLTESGQIPSGVVTFNLGREPDNRALSEFAEGVYQSLIDIRSDRVKVGRKDRVNNEVLLAFAPWVDEITIGKGTEVNYSDSMGDPQQAVLDQDIQGMSGYDHTIARAEAIFDLGISPAYVCYFLYRDVLQRGKHSLGSANWLRFPGRELNTIDEMRVSLAPDFPAQVMLEGYEEMYDSLKGRGRVRSWISGRDRRLRGTSKEEFIATYEELVEDKPRFTDGSVVPWEAMSMAVMGSRDFRERVGRDCRW